MKKPRKVAVSRQIAIMNDTEEEIDTSEIEEEDWIEHMKRSTAIAVARMTNSKMPMLGVTHRRMKWRLAMRIPSLPDEQ